MVMYPVLYLKWIATKGCFIAHESLLNVMWQPKCEGGLRENGCLYTHGWVPLLFTWNYYNIDNWLYPNAKSKNSREKKLCWLLYLGESLCSFSCHWFFLVLHVVCWWTLLAHFFFSVVIEFFNCLTSVWSLYYLIPLLKFSLWWSILLSILNEHL